MEIKLIEPRDPALIPPVNSQGSRQPKKISINTRNPKIHWLFPKLDEPQKASNRSKTIPNFRWQTVGFGAGNKNPAVTKTQPSQAIFWKPQVGDQILPGWIIPEQIVQLDLRDPRVANSQEVVSCTISCDEHHDIYSSAVKGSTHWRFKWLLEIQHRFFVFSGTFF